MIHYNDLSPETKALVDAQLGVVPSPTRERARVRVKPNPNPSLKGREQARPAARKSRRAHVRIPAQAAAALFVLVMAFFILPLLAALGFLL